MKAILVDPYKKIFTNVEISGSSEIYSMIDANYFDVVSIDEKNDIFIDDEGLLSLDENSMFIHFNNTNIALAGKGLVIGINKHGESVDTTLTTDVLEKMISFLTVVEAYNLHR